MPGSIKQSKKRSNVVIPNRIITNCYSEIPMLLNLGFIINLAQVNGESLDSFGNETAIHLASLCGDAKQVSKLISQKKASANKCNSRDFTPLHWAIIGGDRDTVQLLLNNGADARYQNLWGETPLHWAARKGDASILELILKRGGDLDINQQNHKGFIPLHWAVANSNFEVAKMLVDWDTELTIPNVYNATPLHWAACDLSKGTQYPDKKTLITSMLLATMKYRGLSKCKIAKEINSRNVMGYSPLHWSIASENYNLFKVLFKQGGDLNCFDETHDSPKNLACNIKETKNKSLIKIKQFIDEI